jgi:hypothetical protein
MSTVQPVYRRSWWEQLPLVVRTFLIALAAIVVLAVLALVLAVIAFVVYRLGQEVEYAWNWFMSTNTGHALNEAYNGVNWWLHHGFDKHRG